MGLQRPAKYEYPADRDPMWRSVLERPTSRSSVSRAFVEGTRISLGELMGRRLDDVRLRRSEPRRGELLLASLREDEVDERLCAVLAVAV